MAALFRRRSLAAGLLFVSSFVLLVAGLFLWLLRDGLGPDAVESTGAAALWRFLDGFWPVGVIGVGLFGVALYLSRGAPDGGEQGR